MLDFLFGITAFAEGGPTVGGQGMGDAGFMIMAVGMLALFYFMLIRPQKKKEKKTKEMVAAMKVGDSVVSIGGILGKITKIKDDEVVLQTGSIGNPAEMSHIRLAKWAIREVIVKEEA